jgi:ureidoacrylate peracid hydrolase
MKITVPAKPAAITLDSDRAALIVVDMQNSFCKKGGMMDFFGKLDAPMSERVIAADRSVIQTFRKKGIKIIYLRMTYAKDESPESPFYWKEDGLAAIRNNPELKGKFLTEGTRDWEIIDELKPKAADIIVNKSRFSGFTRTELDARLKELNIKYLFFIGLFTNICVESTARDAFFHEYFPILIEDACGNMGPAYIQDATVWNISSVFGWVTTSDDIIKSFG